MCEFKENDKNPSVQAETPSLMSYLCSFTCKASFQIKAPRDAVNLKEIQPEQKKNPAIAKKQPKDVRCMM